MDNNNKDKKKEDDPNKFSRAGMKKREPDGEKSEGSTGLLTQLKQLKEEVESMKPKKGKKKEKYFKLPFFTRIQLKSLAKRNKVQVINLKTNRNIKPVVKKIEDDSVEIDGKLYNISTDFIYLWEGKYPTIILPEWDLQPIGTKDYYDALAQGRKASAQQGIIRRIENAEAIGGKNKLSGKTLIWIGIGAAVLFFILFGGPGTLSGGEGG